MKPEQLAVYFIMGSVNAAGRNPIEVLESALRGGVTCFQLREKGPGALKGEALLEFATACRDLCREHGVGFIVNDDVDLAVHLGADGLHVGQEDGDIRKIRSRIGGQMILGVSAHDAGEAGAALAAGADYLGMGPVYGTRSKPDAREASGTGLIRDAHAAHPDLPIVGIGGIRADNAAPVIRAGASGVSVISAISHASDPARAARELHQAVEEAIMEKERTR
ncbi:thiamine-phosphate diphosphorylase [Edaphobacillus lindanitolerans]|uniref:Thiamine-phosphate synthase n=2 Tax=Edaphobacillus lindanitolerans TaxID=550447 RepID=A0A1U7PR24_9BACI|nr:thiamine-phosphate diphosphorylase [Edaphobacillus lindanitolerans]